jgi:hypothetical protein
MNKLEVAAGLEPAKIGFADRRLDHFGIATLYPNLYPKLYPNRPRIAYLPPTISLQVVDSTCDRANQMVLQTIALPLGDRAFGRKKFSVPSSQFSVKSSEHSFQDYSTTRFDVLVPNRVRPPDEMKTGRVKLGESEASPVPFSALHCYCKLAPLGTAGGCKDPPLH